MNAHPIDELLREHDLVLKVVEAMEREVTSIHRTRAVHRVHVARMLDFARYFTDGCHHHKEEDVLFPVLRERSGALEASLNAMTREHRKARSAMQAVDRALGDADIDPADRAAVAENLGRYAALLRSHMAKEAHVLFPLAELLLNDQEMELLAEEFDRIEDLETGREEHERYEALARELSRDTAWPDRRRLAGGRYDAGSALAA